MISIPIDREVAHADDSATGVVDEVGEGLSGRVDACRAAYFDAAGHRFAGQRGLDDEGLARDQLVCFERKSSGDFQGRAAEAVAGAVGDCFGHDIAAGDGEALHRHAVAEEGVRRLDGGAVAIEDRDEVDEGAAAARVDVGDDRGIGDSIGIEIAEGDSVVDQAHVHALGCTLAVDKGAHAIDEANRGVVVAEEREVVLRVAQLVQRQALRERRFPGKLLAIQPLLQALGAVDPRLLTVGKPGPVVGFAPGELAVGGGLLR